VLSGRRYISIHGEGIYGDVFGEKHWFRFCSWRGYVKGVNASAGSCAAYNDTGDGLPPDKRLDYKYPK